MYVSSHSLAGRNAFVLLSRLKQRSRDISAAAGIEGMAAYAVAPFEPQCLHRRLQNSGAIAHAEARAIASKPWTRDGSESRGQAGVTGPPGSANPLCPCTLHALVAVHTSAGASTVWEGGLAYLSKNHQPNETSMSSSPKRMHSLLPLPGTHRGPRRMDVVRHLRSSTGVSVKI
jgi:hypothetical protein